MDAVVFVIWGLNQTTGKEDSHGHFKLFHPLLFQLPSLEEQLIALGTLILNQKEHMAPLYVEKHVSNGALGEGRTTPSSPHPSG